MGQSRREQGSPLFPPGSRANPNEPCFTSGMSARPITLGARARRLTCIGQSTPGNEGTRIPPGHGVTWLQLRPAHRASRIPAIMPVVLNSDLPVRMVLR
jgi:hypothetical protein